MARVTADTSASGLTAVLEEPRDDAWRTVTSVHGSLPLQRDLTSLRALVPGDVFRVTWTGTFLAARSGPHLFSVASDDGSRVWIDGHLVVDNGGLHPRTWRFGVRDITAGRHAIRIDYEQAGGDAYLDTWIGQPGGLSRRLDATRRLFATGDTSLGVRVSRWLRDWLPWLTTAAGCGAYLALLLAIGVRAFRTVERLAGLPRAGTALALALAIAAMPMVWGLCWGLPADVDGWAPDELTPERLLDGIAARFVAPWASIYPPLHFYILAPLPTIIETASAADGWVASAYPGTFVLHASMRAVTVLMAAGCLAWLSLMVRLHGSAREGLAAVAAAASCSTLLYYAKTANVDVPYLYWTLASCTCVAALARSWSPRLVWLAAFFGACAVGTKDQAAGFLLLMPAWLIVLRRQAVTDTADTPWRTALFDRVWAQAALVAAGTLAAIYLVPFDWTTLPRHIEVARVGTYAPMVPATLAGQLRLLALEFELLSFMFGIPLFVLTVAAVVWATRERRDLAVAVAVPLLSYVGLFLPVIRYTYDRFLLGVAALLAALAGPFALRLWRERQWRPAVAILGALGIAYTAGHALTGNVLMTRDSRYVAERVLMDRAAARRELVGLLSPRTYLPRTDTLPVVDLQASAEDVAQWTPAVLVFDRAWMNRYDARDPTGFQMRTALEDGTLGYGLRTAWQAPVPWWAFQAHPAYLSRYTQLGLTNLDKINPRIEMWERRMPNVE